MVHETTFAAHVDMHGLARFGGPLVVISLSAHLEAILQLGSVKDRGCASVRSQPCTRTTRSQRTSEALAAAEIAQILPRKRAAPFTLSQTSKTFAPT